MGVHLAAGTPTASDDAVVRILIAIELSKKSWIVGANTPLKAKTSQFQTAAGDWKALLELIERLRRQVARELGRPIHEIEVISCYEAGYDGFWLHHHVLEAHGMRNDVLDPASLLVNRRAKPAKTDGIDVERMQRALGRYLRGEVDACNMVRVPSLEEEDAKRLHRERKRLISERSNTSTASKACVHSTASMIIDPCGPTARRSSKVCGPATDVPCRPGRRRKSGANCSGWNWSCR